MITDSEIIRYTGDTYPTEAVLKVDGTSVDLTGWDIKLYYNENQTDGSILNVLINGTLVDPKNGESLFYNRPSKCFNITDPANPIPYVGFVVTGVHGYSIIREKIFYDKSELGDLVFVNGEYVAYDPNIHTGNVDRYFSFTERMTHSVGSINILSRIGA